MKRDRVENWKARYDEAMTRQPPHLVVSEAEWAELRAEEQGRPRSVVTGALGDWAGAQVYVDMACPWGCCDTAAPVGRSDKGERGAVSGCDTPTPSETGEHDG